MPLRFETRRFGTRHKRVKGILVLRMMLAGAICLSLAVFGAEGNELGAQQKTSPEKRELYELRVYQIFDYEKQQVADTFLENALVPALNRQGFKNVGVFTRADDENDHSFYMLIRYPTVADFLKMENRLEADTTYQEAAKEYLERPSKDPVFKRIESRLIQAFAGMPSMEIPEQVRQQKPRFYELRLYESATEKHLERKVQMFDESEIQVMRDSKMGPVFFGRTLIGADAPNLIYMLSADNLETNKAAWKTFLAHPGWLKIKDIPKYKDTVSSIKKWYLKPTAYSGL